MKKFFVVSVLLGAIFFLNLSNVFAGNDISNSLEYLQKFQIEDGGLTEDPAQGSQDLESSWGSIAFASAGYDPSTVFAQSSLRNLNSFTLDNICSSSNITDIERAVLVASASNLDAHNIDGCNLIEKINTSQESDGKIGSDVVSTVFGALALVSANEPVSQSVINYIFNAQQLDGGWSSGWGTEANISAQAIQALVLSGVDSHESHIEAGKNYLKSLQTPGGGIKYDNSAWTTSSDAFSDAYTLQAIYALGESPLDNFWQSNGRGITDDLESLRQDNGSYNFSPDYGKLNPVWTTSIVLVALNQKHLAFHGGDLASYANDDLASPTATPLASQTPSPTPEPTVTVISESQPQGDKLAFSSLAPAKSVPAVMTPAPSATPQLTAVPITEASPSSLSVKGAEDQSPRWKTYLYYVIAIALGLLASTAINKYFIKNDKN